ncbi:DUF1156 domain-containing protein [Tessaracoccus sp. MC1627]|nr:DUF1156 domain-containing protein [Tessaracoccus sp. MC1627]
MSPTTYHQPEASERSTVSNPPKKKLIEVGLPLESISVESSMDKNRRQGHPSTLHLWWSRKPLAAARAVLFAQLVDDPSSNPVEFPTVDAQDAERARLHRLIERLIRWDDGDDPHTLEEADRELRRSNGGQLPVVFDPFAGGGSIPREAHSLGLPSRAGDLNPVAVLISRALVQMPTQFLDHGPVHPRVEPAITQWSAQQALAADVRAYAEDARKRTWERVKSLYVADPLESSAESSDVVAWKWARVAVCRNPACGSDVPLISGMQLSTRKGKEASLVATTTSRRVDFLLNGTGRVEQSNKQGKGAKFKCWVCGDPLEPNEIQRQLDSQSPPPHRMIAVIRQAKGGKVYSAPETGEALLADKAAELAESIRATDPYLNAEARGTFASNAQGRRYGYFTFADYFTDRQLVTLAAFSDVISSMKPDVMSDIQGKRDDESCSAVSNRKSAEAYADSIVTYLALGLSRLTDYNSSLATWNAGRDGLRNTFAQQGLAQSWDYAEANPFSQSSGNFIGQIEWIARVIERASGRASARVEIGSAAEASYADAVISTDPPYYDMVDYSDLSDYFYVWLRRTLHQVHPDLFSTLLTPKADELVVVPGRHRGREEADQFFVDGLNSVFSRIREQYSVDAPMTIYYAYKQKDAGPNDSAPSGWQALLQGLISAGWTITATWPIRTERTARAGALAANSLASSIVLACRPRPSAAGSTNRRAFLAAVKQELPVALRTLMQGTIAPVDLAQAAIGPGIAVFSRYTRVREADGSDMSVKDALLLINSTLDEVIGEQESDFDPHTRFAVKWYRQYGWAQENAGIADQLARSSDTSIGALERGGIFEAKGGKARLLSPSQLEGEWDAAADEHVSVWEATVRFAAVMAKEGADKVAELLPSAQTRVNLDAVKELGFLLFHEAEKRKDTKDAIFFNSLVSAWGDVNEQARKYASTPRLSQQAFHFDEDDED